MVATIVLTVFPILIVGWFFYVVFGPMIPAGRWKILSNGEKFFLARKMLNGREWTHEDGAAGPATTNDPALAFAYPTYDEAKAHLQLIEDRLHRLKQKRKQSKKLFVCDGQNHKRILRSPKDYEKLTRTEILELLMAIRREVPIGNYAVDENLPGRVADLVKENAELNLDLEQYRGWE